MAWYEMTFIGFVIAFFIFMFGVKVGIRIEKDSSRLKRAVQESIDKYVHGQRG